MISKHTQRSRKAWEQTRYPAIILALTQFQSERASHSIVEVKTQMDLSPKRFIHLFEEALGLTPKIFYHLLHFRKGLHQIQWKLDVRKLLKNR